jgi:phosphatidylglycerol:prolipoprotein diacylglycerol transferase
MSFHGGLLGVIVAALLFARSRKLPFLEIVDALAVVTPIGLFFGRIANFINPDGGPEPRHPSQLYEAGLEGIVLLAVMLLFARRPYHPEQRGTLGGIFLIGYALARIVAELFREPDAHLGFLAGGVTMGQLLSLPMLAVGIAAVAHGQRRRRRGLETAR